MSKLRSQLDNLSARKVRPTALQRDQIPESLLKLRLNAAGLASDSHNYSENTRANSIHSHGHRINAEQVSAENRVELNEIKSALLSLTQQLASAGQSKRTPSKEPVAAAPAQCNAQDIDTGLLAGKLATSLHESLRDQISVEIDKMRSELGAFQESAGKASDRAVLDDIHRISEGIQDLQSRQIVSPNQFGEMAGELHGINRNMNTLAEQSGSQVNAQDISNSIQGSYDEIAKRLDSLGTSQSASQIEALGTKLESIKQSITSTSPQALIGIENHLQALSEGISSLVNQGQQNNAEAVDRVLPEYFDSIDRRMDEITRAIVATGTVERPSADEAAFERIEARIASLTKTVDHLAQDDAQSVENPQLAELMHMPGQLQTTLDRLESQISHLTSPANVDDPYVSEEFGIQLASLTQKIDQLQHPISDDGRTSIAAMPDPEMNAKLDALTATLERAVNSGDGSVSQMQEQIADLSNRFEHASQSEQAEQNNRQLSESRIIEELQALAGRVELLDSAPEISGSGGVELAALEDQISSIASQLHTIGVQPDLSAIENRLGGIEQQFAESRDLSIEAVNQAVQQAVSNNGGGNGDGNSAASIAALANDLKALTDSSFELKGHSLETFDAVRNSLSMILDRINSIEMRIADDELSTSASSSIAPQHHEIHSHDMVDAAREFASSLSAGESEPISYGAQQTPPAEAPVAESYAGHDEPLPIVDAPSLDLQTIPEVAPASLLSEDVHADLDAEDLPLEPGSGAPDLSDNGPNMDDLMRRAKENKRKETLESDQQNPTDFIAAARRAAQAAANEENSRENETREKTKKPSKINLKKLLPISKKSMMLGASVLVIASVAFGGFKYFTSSDGSPTTINAELDTPAIAESTTSPSKAELAKTPAQKDPVELAKEQPTIAETVAKPADETVADAIVKPAVRSLNVTENDKVSVAPRDVTASLNEGTTSPRPITVAPMPPAEVGPIALRQAAATGNPRALFEVGKRYTVGLNGKPDLAEAVKWYERAAKAEYAPAQYRLGNFYEKGHGIKSDANQAAVWYKRAADQGNALAMHNLAVINAMGVLDGGANMVEASSWFEKAAEHGVKDSQVNLGIVYAKAMGVEADLAKAYKWFAIAAKAGDKDAAQKRDTVAKQMRPDQLAQVRGEVEIWRPATLKESANSVEIPAEWRAAPEVTASLSNAQMILKTQSILTTLGFKPGPADGLMGAKTVNAIKKFQKRAGVKINGKVTPELISALEKAKI